MERWGLRFEIFVPKGCKVATTKKSFFCATFLVHLFSANLLPYGLDTSG